MPDGRVMSFQLARVRKRRITGSTIKLLLEKVLVSVPVGIDFELVFVPFTPRDGLSTFRRTVCNDAPGAISLVRYIPCRACAARS